MKSIPLMILVLIFLMFPMQGHDEVMDTPVSTFEQLMRFPRESGHRFHVKMATHSTARWPPIPCDDGHPFHAMVATDSTGKWPLLTSQFSL